MSYSMHILNQNNTEEGFDVSELAHDITYTTTLAGQAGKLTFQLEQDPNGILEISIGNIVKFWCDGNETFYGYIFTMGTDRSGVYQITAYDQMRYLQNHDFKLVNGITLPDLFKEICAQAKLKYQMFGKALTDTYKLENHYFSDTSYFDMLEYAINETNTNQTKKVVVSSENTNLKYIVQSGDTLGDIALKAGTTVSYLAKINGIENPDVISVGQTIYLSENASKVDTAEQTDAGAVNYFRYFIRDEFGILTLNDIENNIFHKRTGIIGTVSDTEFSHDNCYEYDDNSLAELQPLIIGDESLLTNYQYELDIDKNTYNELYLMETINDKKSEKSENKKLVLAQQDEDTIKKWGILRKIQNVNSGFTESELKDYAQLSLAEGATISKTLRLEALGYNGINAGDGFLLQLNKLGINEIMYVISATHNYNADKHTMSLEVCSPSKIKEVL